jgi:thiamine biosynthesis protein ThiS
VKLHINGVEQETPDFLSVADLADWLQLPAYGAAIELNGEVIRRAEHAATHLEDGDKLEVVRLVGGG